MVKKTAKTSNVVHFAAWINYYDKAESLTFYNDEYDDVEPTRPNPKPRRRPARETSEEFADRVRVWEAEKAREPIITKPGNTMRGVYYTNKILLIYRDALYDHERRSDELRAHIHPDERYNWYLVEDNDPSYGTRNRDSMPALYKQRNSIETVNQPANSPDLNLIEAIWNIIKERTRR
ncbi:hypothetical protein PTT_08929 [Pyrenophora teres f. teres 0-1]|uniref:Tc1-like transposase DDE domain-containing protein n=1 Tax=Pyrenophora teres f. teres (strain 0-1) TaxID=861557 RepID=E3RKX3_PYRTT|nr:hypothetical protein PTT_08929 [Pyrenophora teres f. teres 0-1]